jgi:hypothetical protein
MELDLFISESIVQITKGLLKAQEQVSVHGVDIKTAGGDAGYSEIDFDVAVTTAIDRDLGGEAKLSVFGIDLKAGKGGEKSDSVASRLKFSVQFAIPEEEMKLIAQQRGDSNKLV